MTLNTFLYLSCELFSFGKKYILHTYAKTQTHKLE